MKTLRELLSLHEGRKAEPYKDSLGFWTIGVGHLIDARKGGTIFGIDSIPMTEANIDKLLDADILKHSLELFREQPWITKMDEVRKAVMQDMTFNLGIEPFDDDGFKDWPMFLNQVNTGQWEAAAKNMLSTTWAKQVGSRAARLAEMMRTGKWPV
jgi:lysozyme